MRAREISEHVLREAAVEAMAGMLDPSTGPRMVLMSMETYELLTPLYAVERQAAERSPDGLFVHFRWGARDVVIFPDRDFVVGPDQLHEANHPYAAARAADLAFGVAMPRQDEPVLLLSGGWRSQGMADLVELARRSGPLGTTTSVPGLVALRLDLHAFGRALGAPPL